MLRSILVALGGGGGPCLTYSAASRYSTPGSVSS
jgi:hypothetical protein